MGGAPRLTTGEGSKQDYKTPEDLMGSVTKRFGQIQFDLAAHGGNAQHERYFAPTHLEIPVLDDAGNFVYETVVQKNKKTKERIKVEIVENKDPKAYAFDAFRHSWAELSRKFEATSIGPENASPTLRKLGVLWLNCEFDDTERWAERCAREAKEGANILLLTPAAVGSNWFRDIVAPNANVYLLNGRVCFDGKNVFPKDCMISHFHPGDVGAMHIWSWRKDELVQSWYS